MAKKIKCPVCGKYEFFDDNDFDICEICGWENDGVQEEDHNYAGGANELSVNEARIEYFLLHNEATAKKALALKNKFYEKMRSARYKNGGEWSSDIYEKMEKAHKSYMNSLNELLNG